VGHAVPGENARTSFGEGLVADGVPGIEINHVEGETRRRDRAETEIQAGGAIHRNGQ
jgi:hypothetical protein